MEIFLYLFSWAVLSSWDLGSLSDLVRVGNLGLSPHLELLSRKILDSHSASASIVSAISNAPTQTISTLCSAKIGSDSGWPKC